MPGSSASCSTSRGTPRMPLDHDLRGLVQVARTAVVAEPGPQVQDFVLGRRGQCLDVGQRCHETVEVTEHGADLGLLQHDFRDPHPVGVMPCCQGRSLRP